MKTMTAYKGIVFSIMFLILLTFIGCGGNGAQEGQQVGQEVQPAEPGKYPAGQPSKVFTLPPERTENWTPDAQEVAQRFREDDYPGAIGVLYEDILNTDPNDSDMFFIYATQMNFYLYDPETIFNIYEYSDRSGWTDEEKAAADILIAITECNGDFSLFQPEDIPASRVDIYEEIMQNYGHTKLLPVAKMLLASEYVGANQPTENVIPIRDDIAREYPDSCYLAQMQCLVAGSYYNLKQFDLALQEYMKVLNLPNIITCYTSTDEFATAHDIARLSIDEINSGKAR